MPRWVAPGIGGTVDACSVTFWPEMITIPRASQHDDSLIQREPSRHPRLHASCPGGAGVNSATFADHSRR